jgi:hypothetical protein
MHIEYTITVCGTVGAEDIAILQRSSGAHPFVAWHGITAVNRIADMMFWVPQSGRLGMGISILSYNGGVTLGVITDAGLVPDPEMITARFEEEFGHILAAAKPA